MRLIIGGSPPEMKIHLHSVMFVALLCAVSQAADGKRVEPQREHPYLLGSRAELQALASQRRTEYQRMARVARDPKADSYSRIISAGLVAAIENDRALAKEVQQLAMKLVNGPIRSGHVTFGYDLALCGFAYDLCSEAWTDTDRASLFTYID